MGRRLGAAALVVAVLALAVRWVGAPRDGLPLDPHGTGPQGLGALVETLERLDADVTVADAPATDADVVLLLRDQLDEAERERLRSWVHDGGRLVVTDPASELAPAVAGPLVSLGTPQLTPDCEVAALDEVDRVEPPDATGFDAGAIDEDSTGCFATEDAAWLAVTAAGDGAIVALGGEAVWVNRHLGEADHAALAMALLAPSPGTRVGVTELRPARAGADGVAGLVPDAVWWGLAQLAVAAALVVAWRFPRDAPVVSERADVALPGSELVLATADLRQQHQARQRAATSLRRAARTHALARLGAPVDAADETLARLAGERAGLDVDHARRALQARPDDDAGLVALGVAVARLRGALDRPDPPGPGPAPPSG